MPSGVKMTTMLFVLILSLMAAFCSAKNNKQSDTKVTASILMATTHFLTQVMLIHGETIGGTYHVLILLNQSAG